MAMAAKIGAKAPDFDLPLGDGERARLRDFKGAPLVLYFYPKDDTAGCTREAIEFTEKLNAFKKAGARVLGVSRDTVAAHAKFAAKHDLKIALGSDEDGAVTEAYGVWVEKTLYGRKYMGIERSTFLIDAKGVIAQAWRKVKVAGHVDEVLAAVKALG
jgi:peroxiredoxin Q/BCP